MKINNRRYFLLLLALVTGALGIVCYNWYLKIHSKSPPAISNQAARVFTTAKESSGEPYSFFVLGDSKGGYEVLENFFQIIQKSKASFLVHLGDIVNFPTPDEHRFFISEISETGFSKPVFIVPGNHDINKDFPHSQELFEKFYGPAHYFFRCNGSLFVIGFCTNKKEFPNFLDFLEETLTLEAANSRCRFVFLHKLPDNFYPGKSIKDDPDAGRLLALVERYKVNYVFAGHLHFYHREVVGNCVFLSPGSGGSLIRRKEVDPNYHCIEITVSPEGIGEKLYSIPLTYFIKDKGDYLEYLSEVKYLPWLKEKARSLLSYLW